MIKEGLGAQEMRWTLIQEIVVVGLIHLRTHREEPTPDCCHESRARDVSTPEIVLASLRLIVAIGNLID
jgi:hypothetical protein